MGEPLVADDSGSDSLVSVGSGSGEEVVGSGSGSSVSVGSSVGSRVWVGSGRSVGSEYLSRFTYAGPPKSSTGWPSVATAM